MLLQFLKAFVYSPVHNGTRIMPKSLVQHNKTRRIGFECWCGLVSTETYMFIRLYTKGGETRAKCKVCGLKGMFLVTK
jgi:hypothetical protein